MQGYRRLSGLAISVGCRMTSTLAWSAGSACRAGVQADHHIGRGAGQSDYTEVASSETPLPGQGSPQGVIASGHPAMAQGCSAAAGSDLALSPPPEMAAVGLCGSCAEIQALIWPSAARRRAGTAAASSPGTFNQLSPLSDRAKHAPVAYVRK